MTADECGGYHQSESGLGLIGCYYTLWGKLIEPPHTMQLLDSAHFLISEDWFSLSSYKDFDHPYYIL